MRKPNGSKGSMRHMSRPGEGAGATRTGTYARNRPSGGLSPNSIHFIATPITKLAPAESPEIIVIVEVY